MSKTLRHAIHLAMTTDTSHRMIEKITGVNRNTLKRYLDRINTFGLTWAGVDKMNDAELGKILIGTRGRSVKKRKPDYAYAVQELQNKYVTRTLLWEDYCIENPETALSYSQYTDGLRKYMGTLDRTMRQIHRPAESIQVDFAGTTITYSDSKTGKEQEAQICIFVLPYSNYTFVTAVKSQKLIDWVSAHVRAFNYFNGVAQSITCDNLKSGITTPGSEAIINPTYAEMAAHYGTVVLPTRVRKPKDKAKVENAVLIVSRWILARLRHQKFFGLDEINNAISELLVKYNDRRFKKLPGTRRSRFEDHEKHLLKPLPGRQYQYAEWIAKQKVGPDYHVYAKGHYYSVPNHLVGSYVEIRISNTMIEVFYLGKRITSHHRNDEPGAHTTKSEHQTREHQAYSEQSPENMLIWAKGIGEYTEIFVSHLFQSKSHPALAIRSCTSLKKLATEYGNERIENACKYAGMIGSLTMTSLRSILRRNIHANMNENRPVQNQLPFHQNLRGATYYSGQEVRV